MFYYKPKEETFADVVNSNRELAQFFDLTDIDFEQMSKRDLKTLVQDRIESTALLIVDPQVRYAKKDDINFGTDETEEVSDNIVEIVPAFKEAGAKAVFVGNLLDDEPDEYSDTHKIKWEAFDFSVYKTTASGFKRDSSHRDPNSRLKNLFDEAGIKRFSTGGFDTSRCAGTTAIDGKQDHGYKVNFVRDATANGKRAGMSTGVALHSLEKDYGIYAHDSSEILDYIAHLKKAVENHPDNPIESKPTFTENILAFLK